MSHFCKAATTFPNGWKNHITKILQPSLSAAGSPALYAGMFHRAATGWSVSAAIPGYSAGLPQGKRPWNLSRFHCYRCILHNFATPLQGSYRTSQVVFQVFPDLLLCVFHNFPWPCTACKSTSFITQSTLPSQHTVREHCTNYYITLHLTYLLYPMQIRCKCQNSSLSSNRSEIKKFAFPGLSKICTNSVLGYRLQRHWDRRDETWLNRQLVVLLCGVVVDSRTSANRSCVKLILVDFHTINTHIWSILLQNTISVVANT